MRRPLLLVSTCVLALTAVISIGNFFWLGYLCVFRHDKYGQIDVPFDPLVSSVFFSVFWVLMAAGMRKRLLK
jgi:hypothetical protein